MKKISKEQREKMEAAIKKIKYRLFQAEVQFASHDHERLKDTARSIRICAFKITRELADEKVKTRKKRNGRLTSKRRIRVIKGK